MKGYSIRCKRLTFCNKKLTFCNKRLPLPLQKVTNVKGYCFGNKRMQTLKGKIKKNKKKMRIKRKLAGFRSPRSAHNKYRDL